MSTTTQRPTPATSIDDAGDPRLDADVSVDIAHLSEVLLGHYPELRLAARSLMEDPRFHRIEGQTVAEHRERVMGQLRLLAAEGDVHRSFPKRFGGVDDHGGFLARFEELSHADLSLQIKSGVQWGLFASAIYHLGTERNHDDFLADALSIKVPGAFAMTETGPRVRRRGHRHHRDVRRGHAGVRPAHAVPCGVEGLPRQRRPARHGRRRVRAPDHPGRGPRGARPLRAHPRRRDAWSSCPASAARTTASRAA